MSDIHSIQSLLNAYAFALDGREYERLREVFTVNAQAEYVGIKRCDGIEEIIRLVSAVLEQCAVTQHLLGSVDVIVQSDHRARACCYLQAIHTGKGEHSESRYTVWGRYDDELIHTAHGWRIEKRKLTTLHAEGDIGLVLE